MAKIRLNSNETKNFNEVGRRTTTAVKVNEKEKKSAGRTQFIQDAHSRREKTPNRQPMIQWSDSASNVKTHAGKHTANFRGEKVANISANNPSIANKASRKLANSGSMKKRNDH
jgi:hypothetical protein